MNGRDLSDDARIDQLTHFRVVRSIAIVEEHADLFSSPLLGVDHGLQLLFVDGHGFLRDGIAAQLHRPDAIDVVVEVDGGDDDDVRLLLRHHLVEVLGLVGGHALLPELDDAVVGGVHAGLVRVADPDQLGEVFEVLDDALEVERRPDPHAYDDISLNLGRRHGGWWKNSVRWF